MKLNRTLFVIMLLASAINSYAQKNIDSILNTLSKSYAQEKIHLVLTKENCVAGETIWFKGFVFDDYEASTISTNLYVDVYNKDNKLISNAIYPIINGISDGSIELSDTLSEGVYYLHAYTQWMLNFDESFHYLKPLTVYNPKSKKGIQKIYSNWNIKVNPEGGNFLAGIENKVAVRRFADWDTVKSWTGYLVNAKNPDVKLVTFTSLDDNVALFSFVPKIDNSYSVIVEDSLNVKKMASLPQVLNNGAVIQVDQHDTLLDYTIYFKGKTAGNNYTLIGTNNNDLVYKVNFINKDSVFFRSISINAFPKGVMHFTLFDQDARVLSERLCFLQPATSAMLHDSVTANYKARGYNEYLLQLDTGKHYNVIVSSDSLITVNDFLGSIWLNADFKQKINHSSGYVTPGSNKENEALDAIMISEHWERFNWNSLCKNSTPKIVHSPDNYLSFKGRVLYKKKPLVNEQLNLLLFYPDSSRQVVEVKTDSLGTFNLNGMAFEGKAVVTYKFLNKKLIKENGSLTFEKPNPVSYILDKRYLNAFELLSREEIKNKAKDEAYLAALSSSKFQKEIKSREMTLADAVVRTRIKSATQQLDEKLSSGRFDIYGRLQVFDFINKEQTSMDDNAFDWLVAKGLVDITAAKSYRYFIDEFPATLVDITMTQMSSVALLKAGSIGKIHDIHLYLKKGGEVVLKADPLNNTAIEGYTKLLPYIMPNYFNDAFNKTSVDNRGILYWGRSINSSTDGNKSVIKYFNNDNILKPTIFVFGFDNNGFPFLNTR